MLAGTLTDMRASKEELAETIGLTVRTVEKWLTGELGVPRYAAIILTLMALHGHKLADVRRFMDDLELNTRKAKR